MQQWQKNLYVSWFAQVLSLMGFGFFMPFVPLFIQELGVQTPREIRVWVGLLASVSGLTLGIMAPIWGIVADKIGRKPMILRALGGAAIIVTLSGLVRSVQALFVLRIFQGLLSGTVTASAALVAGGTPRHKLSFAMGFLSSSNFIGYSLGPLFGGILAELIGYRSTFFVGGAIISVGFVLVLVLVREIRPHAGLDPERAPSRGLHPLRGLLSPDFCMLFLVLFSLRFSRSMPGPFIPLYVQQLSHPTVGSPTVGSPTFNTATEGVSLITGIITGGVGLMAAISGLTLARLGDRYDKRRLISLFTALAVICTLPMFFTRGLWDFALLYLCAAYFLGGIEPNLQSYLSVKTASANRGLLFGVQTLVGSMGWFLAPLVASLISVRLSIKHIFLFYAIALSASFLIGMLTNITRAARRR